jgi:phage tail P2-like protein
MADALLLPPPLAGDERFQALGQLAARISDIDLSTLLVYLVDTVNASALPNLAEQLHILGEGWQFARDDDERRRLLKRAIELHRYKGTRWAIQQVLETLALSGQISEWFEYGGPALLLQDQCRPLQARHRRGYLRRPGGADHRVQERPLAPGATDPSLTNVSQVPANRGRHPGR